MEEMIQTEELSKRYRQVNAADNISLRVSKGEIYGFLGLNGAGKTTTIRMLLGMVRPTVGRAFLAGQKVSPNNVALWRRVGYLVEIPYAYPELTTRQNIEIARKFRGLPLSSVDEVIETLNLGKYENRPASQLSLGNKQRLGLAKAIIHRPEILILDEPANGLDPAGIVEIRTLLRDLAADHGVTIFISSHILDEISRFATRIGIIHEGRLIQELSIDELELNRKRRLIIDTKNNSAALSILKTKGINGKNSANGPIQINDPEILDRPEEVNTILVNSNCPPFSLFVKEEGLEDYFLRIIEESSNQSQLKVS